MESQVVERRRRPRLALHRPVAGEISVMQDVVIEAVSDTDVSVIAALPVARGEQMLLHVDGVDGDGATLVVEGLERRPIVADGQFRHRLRLPIVRAERAGIGMNEPAVPAETRTAPRVGALVRRLPIRVVNISAAGCLLESTLPVDAGTVALVALQIGGRRCVDPVRITRSVRLSGGIWAYRFGADLLNLAPPSELTLRRVALLESAELPVAGTRTTSPAGEPPEGDMRTTSGAAGADARRSSN